MALDHRLEQDFIRVTEQAAIAAASETRARPSESIRSEKM